jgi:Nif-specific regulatory protein
MPLLFDIKQRIQKLLGESMSQLSSSFMELSAGLKSAEVSPEVSKKVEKLFSMVMHMNRTLSGEINALSDEQEVLTKRFEQSIEERRRLEVLYTSGILFSSETELRSLAEKAIDVVVKELSADAGFIVLVDERGEPTSIYTRNMNPDDHPTAKEMSTTVIRNTIAHSSPVQVDDATADIVLAKQQSVIRLGITAALCVPLVSGTKVLGTVYLDRRKKETPFSESDLVFLLSFARQIVRGLETSMEISMLERKLVSETSMKFSDLRREFECPEIIGSSRKLFDILKVSAKIAPTDAPVLLLGENGTGKDLLAQAIHKGSRRSGKPFITINCSAIPHDLLESELFGYESGAFTGATKSKPGKLELADGGTVFFDELGELTINLQAKLLRVIQTKELERLGSTQPHHIDVRFIAATNRNIAEMIEQGTFREDLYYRLKVIELTMPPLRERREDITELVEYFLKKYSSGVSYTVTREALEVLEHYPWHGNIRELENVIHRSIVLAKGAAIGVDDLPPELVVQSSQEPSIILGKTLLDAETEFRRLYIIKTLRETKSVAEAAKVLGINRTHFYKLLSQLEIEY